MSYIGNEPTSVAFLTDTFSGNGSTTAFTLSAAPAGTSSILVAITGVVQDPSTYSVVGTTLTFSPAPPTGTGNISVRFLGIPASGVTTTAYRTVTEFTATAGQTTFSVPSYTVGFIDVYRNGVMLGSADYTASNGVSVVLASGATAGDLVEVISFSVSSVLNAVQPTGTTFSGNVLFASGNGIWNSSGNVGIGTASPTVALDIVTTNQSAKITGSGLANWVTIANTSRSFNYGVDNNGFNVYDNTAAAYRMIIDSAGRVTMPAQPGFRAGLQGSTPSIAAGALWRFDTASGNGRFNTGGHYNTSTYTFTAPIAGRYYFHMQVIAEGTANNTARTDMIVLRINGGVAAYSEKRGYYVVNVTGDGGFYVDNVTAILQLSAGDTVNGANNSPSAATQHANGVYSIFEGYLLG